MGDHAIPEIRLGELDGVTVFSADAPAPYEVQLLFRVGRADERLVDSGITHLVEHLAMPPGPVTLECNAFVTSLMTGFWARGDLPELTEFVSTVVGRLATIPRERIDVERRILLAEEDLGTSASDLLASRRFGAVGYGLVGLPQLGLRRLSEAMVSDWASRYTAENAALWVRGPSGDFEVELSSGPRHPIPDLRSLAGLRLPAFLNWELTAVALDVLLPRNPVGEVAAEVLHARTARRLRFERGLVYAVEAVGAPLTADEASVSLHVNCRPDYAGDVRDGLLAVADELAAEGPSEDELLAAVRVVRRRMSDPALLGNLLFMHAYEHLVGLPWTPLDEASAGLGTVTPAEIAALLSGALETGLLALPVGLDGSGSRFGPPPESPAEQAATGEEFRRRRAFFGPARRERLVVGPNGVTHTSPGHAPFTVRWETCAAVLAWPDGTRCLWGESGFLLYVLPMVWRGGERLAGLVDELAPSGLLVDMEEDAALVPA